MNNSDPQKINTKDLQSAIAIAFLDNIYPGDMCIANRDDDYPDYEGNQVATFLQGKKWNEINYESICTTYPGDQSAIIHFLSDEGFRYYLPAFLMMALNPTEAREMIDSLVSALTFTSDSSNTNRFENRITALSKEQQKVVINVLRFLAKHYNEYKFPDNPAQSALQTIESKLE